MENTYRIVYNQGRGLWEIQDEHGFLCFTKSEKGVRLMSRWLVRYGHVWRKTLWSDDTGE